MNEKTIGLKTTYIGQKNTIESNLEYEQWVNTKRAEGFVVGKYQIIKRLSTTENWIRRNLCTSLRHIKCGGDRSSTLLFNEHELDSWLYTNSIFTLKTVRFDFASIFDPNLDEDKAKLQALENYYILITETLKKGHHMSRSDRTRLATEENIVNAICEPIVHGANYLNRDRCYKFQFDPSKQSEDELPKGFAEIFKEIFSKGRTIRTGHCESNLRNFFCEGMVHVAVGGYKGDNSCEELKAKKAIYIDLPVVRQKNGLMFIDPTIKNSKYTYTVDFPRMREWLLRRKNPESAPVINDSVSETIEQKLPNQEQQDFINLVLEALKKKTGDKRSAYFLTGSAGTGKSFTVNQLVQCAEKLNKKVIKLAPTAVAAAHIDGQTIHSFFNINPAQIIPYDFKITRYKNAQKVSGYDLIIIDEVSMLRCDLFKHIIEILNYRNPEAVVLFVGDFFQLPPVMRQEDQIELCSSGWPITIVENSGYAFLTQEWANLITKDNFYELTTIHRQRDQQFAHMLQSIRHGDKLEIKQAYEWIRLNCCQSRENLKHPIEIYPFKEQVQIRNNYFVSKLDATTIRAKYKKIYDELFTDAELEHLLASSTYNVKLNLTLAVGARVITTFNSNSYINGTRGTIKEILEDSIIIVTDAGSEITVERVSVKVNVPPAKKARFLKNISSFTISQFPIDLAYAFTVHKCQGLTLNEVILYPEFWTNGLGYVALSRISSVKGLYLMTPPPVHSTPLLLVDPLVAKFYQQRSLNLEELFSSEDKNLMKRKKAAYALMKIVKDAKSNKKSNQIIDLLSQAIDYDQNKLLNLLK